MFITIAMVALLTSLALAGAVFATVSLQGANYERAGVSAIAAAEAGVDTSYVGLKSGNFACTGAGSYSAPSQSMPGGAPVSATYSVTIKFYDATMAQTCVNPTSALIRSLGTYSGSTGLSDSSKTRLMESYVRLQPVTAQGGGGAAVFSGNNFNATNNFNLHSGTSSADANIYIAQGSFSCSNNTPLGGGSVIIPNGGLALSGGCKPTVAGDVWVSGDITSTGGSSISVQGSMLSSGGNVNLSGATIAKSLRAAGSITGSNTVGGQTSSHDTTVPVPPEYPFPQISYVAANWAGYTTVTLPSNICPTESALEGYVTPTVVIAATCSFNSPKNLALRTDIAIFASSFDFGGSSVSAATPPSSGQRWKLRALVPWDLYHACTPGTHDIVMNNQTDFSSDVALMAYTPCTINANNNSSLYGQFYGGTNVSIANHFDMTFDAVGIPGIQLPGGPPQATGAYNVDVVYKRENTSTS